MIVFSNCGTLQTDITFDSRWAGSHPRWILKTNPHSAVHTESAARGNPETEGQDIPSKRLADRFGGGYQRGFGNSVGCKNMARSKIRRSEIPGCYCAERLPRRGMDVADGRG